MAQSKSGQEGSAEITIERGNYASLRNLSATLASLLPGELPTQEGIDISGRSMPIATDVPGGEREPIYRAIDQADIQGNILPGFNKPRINTPALGIGTRCIFQEKTHNGNFLHPC